MVEYYSDNEGPSPSVGEVVHHEKYPSMDTIPVCITNAVETRPARYARMRTIAVGNTPTTTPVIDYDPRYRRVWVSCATNNVQFGTASQLKANSPDGFILNSGGTPIPWEGFDEEPIYAMAVTGTATISLRFEFWAD